MSKFLHTAHAAGQGVYVALLAREGFSGATHILEGEQGFFKGYALKDVNCDKFEDFFKVWRSGNVSLNLIHVVVIRILQLMRLWT